MTSEPDSVDGYVSYEQGQRPVLYDPAEAEALAMSLLGAASRARAHRLSEGSDGAEGDSEECIV